jgi:hypothetical protein
MIANTASEQKFESRLDFWTKTYFHHRMKSRIVLVGVILVLAKSIDALEITACDCSAVENLGLLAFQNPNVCKYDVNSTPTKAEYVMMAVNKEEISWDGYSCAAWVKEKNIDGYFFGSYDTTFNTYTATVTEAECRHMQKFQTCFGNQMTWNNEFYVFEKTPSGEGAWMQSVKYRSINCIVKAIKLSKSCDNCPIKTGYGVLSNDSMVQTAVHNHIRFIWDNPKRSKAKDCELTELIKGIGYVIKHSESTHKLVDSENQLEFIFNSSKIDKCEHEQINKILGLPDAFIAIHEQKQQPLIEHTLFKHQAKGEWGSIITSSQDLSKLCVELIPETKSLTLSQCSNSINQLFRKIRDEITFANTTILIPKFCVVWKNFTKTPDINHNLLLPHICNSTIPGSGWVFQKNTSQIKIQNLCLDASMEGNRPKLWMSQCEVQEKTNKVNVNFKSQQWNFKPINLENGEVIDTTGRLKSMSNGLTKETVEKRSDNMIMVEHHQFIEGRAIARETLLATEIKNIYCQLQHIKASHITSLAQLNGFLAANALEMPLCRRIQASGKALLVQSCKPVLVFVLASKSPCGFTPIFQLDNVSYTIGLDGYSIHKLDSNKNKCFWKNGIVNLNDRSYAWTNNEEWKEINPNIWSDNIEIIKGFNETVDNEFQYMIVDHPSDKTEIFEQLNMLNEVLSDVFNNEEDGIIDKAYATKNRLLNFIEWIKSIIASMALSVSICGIVLLIYLRPTILITLMGNLRALLGKCCGEKVQFRPEISPPISQPPSDECDPDDPQDRYSLVPIDEANERVEVTRDSEI